MYQYNIGIDVSKADFSVAVHGIKQVKIYSNTVSGFAAFFAEEREKLLASLVVLETTGGYEYRLLAFLIERGIKVHRASGRQIKHFIRSYGKQGKSDKIDALAIAHYSYERQASLAIYDPPSADEQQLRELVERRLDLVQMLVQEKNRAKAPGFERMKERIGNHIRYLQEAIKEIEQAIKHLNETNKCYLEKEKVLTSIAGIGSVTAFNLLGLVPELGKINRRQVASLLGVAPHPQESGQKQGYRKTSGGRRDVRPILYTAALAAARSKSRLGDWYRQTIARGKKRMVAIVALMRKIIVIANAKIRDLSLVTT